MTAPSLLYLKEIADELRVCVVTARRWVRSGRLPAVRVGRSYRVSREALEQLTARGLPPARPRA